MIKFSPSIWSANSLSLSLSLLNVKGKQHHFRVRLITIDIMIKCTKSFSDIFWSYGSVDAHDNNNDLVDSYTRSLCVCITLMITFQTNKQKKTQVTWCCSGRNICFLNVFITWVKSYMVHGSLKRYLFPEEAKANISHSFRCILHTDKYEFR